MAALQVHSGTMFQPGDRDRIQHVLIERARGDARIVAAAAVGGSAGVQDRWSDIDLTFGVAAGTAVDAVLSAWTDMLVRDFGAAVLFDLPFRSTIYRVFLLPGALQVDLSFSPAEDFGATGPRFRPLFGEWRRREPVPAPDPQQMFGMAVHHIVRAHVCIERGRLWQAEHWLHEARDEALSLACLRCGLETRNGRGFDALPAELLSRFWDTFAASPDVARLRRALAALTAAVLEEGEAVGNRFSQIRLSLQEMLGADTRRESTASGDI